jgi:hypothetical protein
MKRVKQQQQKKNNPLKGYKNIKRRGYIGPGVFAFCSCINYLEVRKNQIT